ncbi:hypothetical protein [uncultured Cohaesibacter sp.]|uniref:hypothetical protein n=1 Tax=uncultured Cohaesibacter sp. TaxID=1002546 RepID=UPI002930C77A|nr:hypothetical protein [uncultured Cohaesibacter sp.]
MIAIIMYILLGVFATLLLMLIIVPLIWKRAVRLTQKRFIAEMPISYSELQAEKDHQRAELAIELRRLEVLADRRLEEVANSSLKIDRLKNTITKRETEIANRLSEIEQLEETLEDRQQELSRTNDGLKNTQQKLKEANETISGLYNDVAKLEEELRQRETDISEQKVEIVAQLARIESHREEIANLNSDLNAEIDERKKTQGLLNQKATEFDRAKERLAKQQEKIDDLQAKLADKDTEISNLTRQLQRAAEQTMSSDEDGSKLLAEAEARRLEAEVKIASLAMQLEHHEDGENLSSVIEGLENDKQKLEDELKTLRDHNEKLNEKLSGLEARQAQDDEKEALSQKEILLRNEMKQIAERLAEFKASTKNKPVQLKAAEITDTIEHSASQQRDGEIRGGEDTNAQQPAQEAAPKKTRQELADPWSQVVSLAEEVRELENS